MAARKNGSRRAAPTMAERRITILLENIEAQNRATIEAVHACEGRLRRDLGLRFDNLEARVAALETAVQIHSEVLAEHSKTLADHSKTLAEHSRLHESHSQQLIAIRATLERIEAQLASADEEKSLESRVARLEQEVFR